MPPSKKIIPTSTVYLVFGTDTARVEEECRRIVADYTTKPSQPAECETLDGQMIRSVQEADELLRQVVSSLQTFSFLTPRKIVWIRQCEFLKRGEEIGRPVREKLVELLEKELSEGTALLVSATAVDKASRLHKWALEKGEVAEFAALNDEKRADREQLFDYAEKRLLVRRKRIEPDAFELLLEFCGSQTDRLSSELEKLDLYSGKRSTITAEDVQAVSSGERETIFWKLRDAIGARQVDEALAVLHHLLEQGEEPVQLVASLVHTVGDLLSARRLLDEGAFSGGLFSRRYWEAENAFRAALEEAQAHVPDSAAASLLGRHPFAVFQVLKFAVGFSGAELLRCLDYLYAADRALKSTPLCPAIVLEETLLQILGCSQQAVLQLED